MRAGPAKLPKGGLTDVKAIPHGGHGPAPLLESNTPKRLQSRPRDGVLRHKSTKLSYKKPRIGPRSYANFSEPRTREVRRINPPRTPVNRVHYSREIHRCVLPYSAGGLPLQGRSSTIARLLLRGLQGGWKAIRSLLLRGQLRRSRGTHNSLFVHREKFPNFLEEDRVKILLRSVRILDEWLKDNEEKLKDEVRIRRVKHWREEALEQLRRKLNLSKR